MTRQLQARLQTLRKTLQQQARFQHNFPSLAFVARPTCPPSTAMVMQGGVVIETEAFYDFDLIGGVNWAGWTVPTITRDLADEDEAHVDAGCFFSGDDLNYSLPDWNTAYYYKMSVLHLALPQKNRNPAASDWILFLHVSTAEFATSQEAESYIMTWVSDWHEYEEIPGAGVWYDDEPYWPYPYVESDPNMVSAYRITGIPLCGIILKNNGTTGTGRHFLPIDAVNRGRSYTWPRDLRPQWIGT